MDYAVNVRYGPISERTTHLKGEGIPRPVLEGRTGILLKIARSYWSASSCAASGELRHVPSVDKFGTALTYRPEILLDPFFVGAVV